MIQMEKVLILQYLVYIGKIKFFPFSTYPRVQFQIILLLLD